MKKAVLILIPLVLVAAACGYQEGILQKADGSYLSFNGDPRGVSVQLDGNERFPLEGASSGSPGEAQPPEKKLYRVTPGNHRLRVYRGEELVVDRIIYVGNQATFEVDLP